MKPNKFKKIIPPKSADAFVYTDRADREEKSRFCLRMPMYLSNLIDNHIKGEIGINKTGFIQQAIKEKLEREGVK